MDGSFILLYLITCDSEICATEADEALQLDCVQEFVFLNIQMHHEDIHHYLLLNFHCHRPLIGLNSRKFQSCGIGCSLMCMVGVP